MKRVPHLAAILCPLLVLAMPHARGEDQWLRVELQGRQDVERLEALGARVDDASDSEATVYVDEQAFDRLRQDGWKWEVQQEDQTKDFSGYHSYEALTNELQAYAAAFPHIARLESLGTSVEGRQLWAMRITDAPDAEEEEPEFKYVSTMHGDETVGTELCLRFIDLLLNGYGSTPRITQLVDETDIWIVPLMNPDGLELVRRTNARGVDLNRSFPNFSDDFRENYYHGGTPSLSGREPEIRAIMQWSLSHSFVLSANMHTGSQVVNYPYDYIPGIPSGAAAASPDEALFRVLSRRYAATNPDLNDSLEFPGGISNGSDWYSITGGMQDWNYRYLSCMEVTLELSNVKRPASGTLAQLWEKNRESMLAYLEGVHLGVRGIVTGAEAGGAVWAEVSVAGNAQPVYSDPQLGDYYRILLPGVYTLSFSADGLIPFRAEVEVGEGAATRLDVALSNGDVDGSGGVDAADIQRVLNAIANNAEGGAEDVDGLGVSVTDLQWVVNRALVKSPDL